MQLENQALLMYDYAISCYLLIYKNIVISENWHEYLYDIRTFPRITTKILPQKDD